MPELRDLLRPAVTRPAGFDPDQARWRAFSERQNLSSAQALVEGNLARLSDPVNLKDILGPIQANGGNLHGVAPLSQMTTPALWCIATLMEQEPSTPSAKLTLKPLIRRNDALATLRLLPIAVWVALR